MTSLQSPPAPEAGVAGMRRWVTDTRTGERFPHYTRANADEVAPRPITPLGWCIGWAQGAVPGVVDGYVRFGIAAPEEFRRPDPEMFGCWGGYFYNQLSLSRLLGVRTPGASAQAIDAAYFGSHPGVPPYVPDPRDEAPAQTEKLVATMAAVLSAERDEPLEELAAAARDLRLRRPDLAALSDVELVAHGRTFGPWLRHTWDVYAYVVLAASIGPGAVEAVCSALGRPDAVAGLFGSLGGVETARASAALWRLSRTVRHSPALTREFDAGVEGLVERLQAPADESVQVFATELAAVLDEFGHRGSNEWDIGSPSWEVDPSLALSMVERLRLQEDDQDPEARSAAGAAQRELLRVELLALAAAQSAETERTLRMALRSGTLFYRLRERGKDAAVRIMNEGRQPFRELGRRLVARGQLDRLEQVFLLLDAELDALLADPGPLLPVVRQRERDFADLAELEPPYIVSHPDAPPVSSWPRRGGRAAVEPAAAGSVLTGTGVSAGRAGGPARIVPDLSRAGELEPGDVLVCATTDPSWVPLFLVASAVVCDVGALGSHAAIVSRELGVPCVVSVLDATSRIPAGALLTVDGSAGTVTLDH